MSPVRIIGIGSPFGDDQVGWRVIEALEEKGAAKGLDRDRVSLVACDRPGARLLTSLRGAELAIVVDAVQSGAAPGTVHRLETSALITSADQLSSHGFGLAAALALAAALGEMPGELMVYGIEIGADPASTPSGSLTQPVAKAVDDLIAAIVDELRLRVAPASAGVL